MSGLQVLFGNYVASNPAYGPEPQGSDPLTDNDVKAYLKLTEIVERYDREQKKDQLKRDLAEVKADLTLRTAWIDYQSDLLKEQGLTEREVLRAGAKSKASMDSALIKMSATRGSTRRSMLSGPISIARDGQYEDAWGRIVGSMTHDDPLIAKMSDIEVASFFEESVANIPGVNWDRNTGAVTFKGYWADNEIKKRIREVGLDAAKVRSNQEAARTEAKRLDAEHDAYLKEWKKDANRDINEAARVTRQYLLNREAQLTQAEGIRDQDEAATEQESLQSELDQYDAVVADWNKMRTRMFGTSATKETDPDRRSNLEKTVANENFQFWAKMNNLDVGKVVQRQKPTGRFRADGSEITETVNIYLPKVGDAYRAGRYYFSSKRENVRVAAGLPPKFFNRTEHMVRVTSRVNPETIENLAITQTDGTKVWAYLVDGADPSIRTNLSPRELRQLRKGERPEMIGNINSAEGLKYIAYLPDTTSSIPEGLLASGTIYKLTDEADEVYQKWRRLRDQTDVADEDAMQVLLEAYNEIPFDYEPITKAEERAVAANSLVPGLRSENPDTTGLRNVGSFDNDGEPVSYLSESQVGTKALHGVEFIDDEDAEFLKTRYGKVEFDTNPPPNTITRIGKAVSASRDGQVTHGTGTIYLVDETGERVLVKGDDIEVMDILAPAEDYTLQDMADLKRGRQVSKFLEQTETGEFEEDQPGTSQKFGNVTVRDVRPIVAPGLMRIKAPGDVDKRIRPREAKRIADDVEQGRVEALRRDIDQAEADLDQAKMNYADLRGKAVVGTDDKFFLRTTDEAGDEYYLVNRNGIPTLYRKAKDADKLSKVPFGDNGGYNPESDKDMSGWTFAVAELFGYDMDNPDDAAILMDPDKALQDLEKVVGLREEALNNTIREYQIGRGLDPDAELETIDELGPTALEVGTAETTGPGVATTPEDKPGEPTTKLLSFLEDPRPFWKKVNLLPRKIREALDRPFELQEAEPPQPASQPVDIRQMTAEQAGTKRAQDEVAGLEAAKSRITEKLVGEKIAAAYTPPNKWVDTETTNKTWRGVEYTFDPEKMQFTYISPAGKKKGQVITVSEGDKYYDGLREKQDKLKLVSRVKEGKEPAPWYLPKEGETVSDVVEQSRKRLDAMIAAVDTDAYIMEEKQRREAALEEAGPVDTSERPTEERELEQVEEAASEALDREAMRQLRLVSKSSVEREVEVATMAAEDAAAEAAGEDRKFAQAKPEQLKDLKESREAMDALILTGELPPGQPATISPEVVARIQAMSPERRREVLEQYQTESLMEASARDRYLYSRYRIAEMETAMKGLDRDSEAWKLLNQNKAKLSGVETDARSEMEAAGEEIPPEIDFEALAEQRRKDVKAKQEEVERLEAEEAEDDIGLPEEPEAVDPLVAMGLPSDAIQWDEEGKEDMYAYSPSTDQFFFQSEGKGKFVEQTTKKSIDAMKALGEAQGVARVGDPTTGALPWSDEAKELREKIQLKKPTELDIFDVDEEEEDDTDIYKGGKRTKTPTDLDKPYDPERSSRQRKKEERREKRKMPRGSAAAAPATKPDPITSPTPTATAMAVAPGKSGVVDPSRPDRQMSMLQQALRGQYPSAAETEEKQGTVV